MGWKRELKAAGLIGVVFAAIYLLPLGSTRFDHAVLESLHLAQWYAREHVVLCLVPAFLIAGAIAVFTSKAAVLKYLGAGANRFVAYGVASISGSVLAVCSCTVLPLFAGITARGAGIGPASAFLYAGPAINVLAIIFTARVLGFELGIARAIGAIAFSIIIGLLMQLIFRRGEEERRDLSFAPTDEDADKSHRSHGVIFVSLVGILVFANWSSAGPPNSVWSWIASAKWILTAVSATALVLALSRARRHGGLGEWLSSSWGYAKQMLPLLLVGVLIAGALLGRPNEEGLIPSAWVSAAVGGNSLGATLIASVAGAFMYFATLTEVPILQGLLGSGMGKGPALALLLAGPALSLPNMLVLRSVLGTTKTIVYVALVVVMATSSGMIYGAIMG